MRVLRSFEFCLVVFLLLVAAAYWIRYAPLLPERVPTHFGMGGQADAWSSVRAFAWAYWGILFGQVAVFLGIAGLILKVPKQAVSLPHREFWMSPEREAHTRHDLARRLLGFCAMTMIFYLLIFHFSIRAALDGTNRLSGQFNWVLGGFLGYTAIWTGVLLWRYSRIPKEP